MVLTLKGIDSSAQMDVSRTMCYKIGPRYKKIFDVALSDRFLIKPNENTFSFKAGSRKRGLSPGLSLCYQGETTGFGIGPYYRVFTIADHHFFEHYIEFNYQFMFNKTHRNEINITSGFVLFHESPTLSIDLACQYTYTYGSGDNHLFRPVIGVHYYIYNRPRRKRSNIEEKH
jgi:hypothetical protein